MSSSEAQLVLRRQTSPAQMARLAGVVHQRSLVFAEAVIGLLMVSRRSRLSSSVVVLTVSSTRSLCALAPSDEAGMLVQAANGTSKDRGRSPPTPSQAVANAHES